MSIFWVGVTVERKENGVMVRKWHIAPEGQKLRRGKYRRIEAGSPEKAYVRFRKTDPTDPHREEFDE